MPFLDGVEYNKNKEPNRKIVVKIIHVKNLMSKFLEPVCIEIIGQWECCNMRRQRVALQLSFWWRKTKDNLV